LAFSAAIVTEIVRGTVEFQVAAFGSASSAWQKFYRL
jgi:hypothetical protein